MTRLLLLTLGLLAGALLLPVVAVIILAWLAHLHGGPSPLPKIVRQWGRVLAE